MKAFKCHHSDLLFPGDYVKQWGILYGIGMGSEPCSEVLNSHDHLPKAEAIMPGSDVFMHPMGVTHAGLTEVDVTQEEFDKNAAILHRDDPQLHKRTMILIEKQKAKAKKIAADAWAEAQKVTV